MEKNGSEGLVTDSALCLVGRFLTDRSINNQAMKSTLAALWRSVKGMSIKDLTPSVFLFLIYHEMDLERVVRGGPWTFDRDSAR